MNFGTNNFEHALAGGGHANAPAHVPFAEFVEPFLYVGEEITRAGIAAVRAVTGVASAVNGWRNKRATIKTLQALEDHRLDDIGVRREEIAALAGNLEHA